MLYKPKPVFSQWKPWPHKEESKLKFVASQPGFARRTYWTPFSVSIRTGPPFSLRVYFFLN